MQLNEEQRLRERTAALMIDWAATRVPPFTGDSREGYDAAITAAHVIADESRVSLHRWVDAARRAGLSWAEIGGVLGISKQAAQQRFGTAEPAITPDPDLVVVRLGATAFNEMAILRAEGARGRELVKFGPLILYFRPTDQNWAYRRTISLAGPSEALLREGWTYVGSWLPFQYYKRPLEAG
ncbi:MAG: hypothetical protein A4S12_03365 [Proteobacteria bacterium SG_bin5]|nr:DUF2812 domain-containing protein [Sphingomonas sp.]OQW44466.1 MAG: hypothetical protein A4S12_03365 [Proteobacteria bacterium SG_bin5]